MTSNAVGSQPRPLARRAYTLAELLVVMSIFVLVLAIAVPSFSSLIYSTERSQAENQLGVVLGAARSAAMSTEGLGDTAAVFFFDSSGRTRIGVYVNVGQMDDVDLNDSTKTVTRDVFVPSPAFQAVQMPRNWMVRAYAPPGAIDGGGAGTTNGWYEANAGRAYDKTTGNWVFPETSFYDQDVANSGEYRQTFMVRFEAGTGMLSAKRSLTLVVDPSPSKVFRAGIFGKASLRLDSAEDLAGRVRRLLGAHKDLGSTLATQRATRQQILGGVATDSVLARPVAELAFYDERHLAGALGARGLNAVTGCLYGDPSNARAFPKRPTIDSTLVKSSGSTLSDQINAWIQGTSNSPVPSDAKLFTIDRFQGQTKEVMP